MNQNDGYVLATQPDPDYRIIPLTKDQFAKVDACDYDFLMQWKWYAWWNDCTESYYAARQPRVAETEYAHRRRIHMGRAILGMSQDERCTLDHRNHDTLDFRRCNIRKASYSQNACNRKWKTRNTSGFKGVHWNKWNKKWAASIGFDKKRRHIGYFLTPEDASKAYQAEAERLHGEFRLC